MGGGSDIWRRCNGPRSGRVLTKRRACGSSPLTGQRSAAIRSCVIWSSLLLLLLPVAEWLLVGIWQASGKLDTVSELGLAGAPVQKAGAHRLGARRRARDASRGGTHEASVTPPADERGCEFGGGGGRRKNVNKAANLFAHSTALKRTAGRTREFPYRPACLSIGEIKLILVDGLPLYYYYSAN